jgi:hypothetical protein
VSFVIQTPCIQRRRLWSLAIHCDHASGQPTLLSTDQRCS